MSKLRQAGLVEEGGYGQQFPDIIVGTVAVFLLSTTFIAGLHKMPTTLPSPLSSDNAGCPGKGEVGGGLTEITLS